MDILSGHLIQLILGLIGSIFIFVAVFILPEKIFVNIMILMMPFQIIDSRYGSINTLIIYVAFIAFLIKRRINSFPLMFPTLLIVISYFISSSMAIDGFSKRQVVTLVSLFSNYLVFIIIYNYLRMSRNFDSLIKCFVAQNFLVVLYCMLQLYAGFKQIELFGMHEWALVPNRLDQRLSGPFNAVGISAEYFLINIYILFFLLLFNDSLVRKKYCYLLIVSNLSFMVATGNRGAFLVLIGYLLFFYAMFNRKIRFSRAITLFIFGMVALITASIVMVKFTKFNTLYERLEKTKVEKGVPDSRSVLWPIAIREIKNMPFFGHGPAFKVLHDDQPQNVVDQNLFEFPHNLYFFVLYTTGLFGFISFVVLILTYYFNISFPISSSSGNELFDHFPKLGVLLFFIFLTDQLKVEFLRFNLTDYQQIIFALASFFLAVAHNNARIANQYRKIIK